MNKVKSLFLPIIIHLALVTFVSAEADTKCGFQEVLEALRLGVRLVRPDPGPEFVYSEHFVIHYATSGPHQTTRAYAESVSAYAEYSWAKQIDTLGWAAPPS
uniref:Uncharacterized protein n=1 Tax=candidate division WOR-3 bacterium TaxID=2052148 RepID=A0A7C3YQ16_UNCW3